MTTETKPASPDIWCWLKDNDGDTWPPAYWSGSVWEFESKSQLHDKFVNSWEAIPSPSWQQEKQLTPENMTAQIRTVIVDNTDGATTEALLNWLDFIGKPQPMQSGSIEDTFDFDWYQEWTATTESPMTPDEVERWDALWPKVLDNLHRLSCAISELKLDNSKKYGSYGKIPDDLQILGVTPLHLAPESGWQYRLPGDVASRQLLHMLLGLASELEELLQSFLTTCSRVPHSHTGTEPVTIADFDRVNFGEEIGDQNWYANGIARIFNLKMKAITVANYNKLEKRYRDKKAWQTLQDATKDGSIFTPEAAQQRDIPTEQAGLASDFEVLNAAPVPAVAYTEEEQKQFCSFCDHHGHLWDDCPERKVPVVAAPLMIEQQCKHERTHVNRVGKKICKDCGEDVTAKKPPSTFGF